MRLKLKNIGIIKNADVKIEGLTLIAGENDTGKSTVGKALFLVYHDMALNSDIHNQEANIGTYKNTLLPKAQMIKKAIFSKEGLNDSDIREGNSIIELHKGNKSHRFHHYGNLYQRDIEIANIAFIETPLVWNMQEFFRNLSDIESRLKQIGESVEISYPYFMKDLYYQLVTKVDKVYKIDELCFLIKLCKVISGEFVKGEDGIYRYQREGQEFDLNDVATGIKAFGILQVLIKNNRLNNHTLLILDEPEVHLHPKWQLKMAELIVSLVKNGVKIVVNSHSPYMIEALQRYGKQENINSNFYFAEGGNIRQINDSNDDTLAKIFEKLSEPFELFDKMDMENIVNG